jgi:hypothetical protein
MTTANDLDALLVEVGALSERTLMELSVQPSGAAADELETARAAWRVAAEKTGRSKDVERLMGQIVTWSGANGAHSGAWTMASPPADQQLSDMRRGAAQAIFDAAVATYLADALEPATAATLRARWDAAQG